MFPEIALAADDVLPVDVKTGIDLDRFWKIISAPGDLIDDGSVGGVEMIIFGRNGEEAITSELLEDRVLIVPWPVDKEKPEPNCVSYRKVLEIWL